ncbi:sulfatase-like hydrolase/transferase [Tichowtungia aerotolerans]
MLITQALHVLGRQPKDSPNVIAFLLDDSGQRSMGEVNTAEPRLQIGYALPFRDGKGSTWESGVRVPAIFCWEETISPNRIVQKPASTLDILPTVFALTGVRSPRESPYISRASSVKSRFRAGFRAFCNDLLQNVLTQA